MREAEARRSVNISNYLRGKRISKRLVFGGGYPLFRILPRYVCWGRNVSLYWFGLELVFLGVKRRGRGNDKLQN